MKTLILGLGNPLLGDDGVGWRVAEECARRMPQSQVECFSIGGLSLMERFIGYDRAILVDAVTTRRQPVGTVRRYQLEELNESATHASSPHDTTLKTALEVGRSLGAELPQKVIVVGIEAENTYEFSEELSPAVAAAVPRAVQAVIEIVERVEREAADAE